MTMTATTTIVRIAAGTVALALMAPGTARATPTQIQCLRLQNAWIEDCMDGVDGFWTSITGQLDQCVAEFDMNHQGCVAAGVSAEEAAEDIHTAYGAAGEIIGGSVGIVGSMVGNFVQCGAAAGVVLWVGIETGDIYAGGSGFSDTSVSDETIEELTDACMQTAMNAGVLAGAIIAPQIVAGVLSGYLVMEMGECYDACFNDPDPSMCTDVCYDMGAEAGALLGMLYAGHVISQSLPPEMLEPTVLGYNLQPWNAPPVELTDGYQAPAEQCRTPECLDEFYDNFRYQLGDPDYVPNSVNDYGFSGHDYFPEQFGALNAEIGNNSHFGGQFELVDWGMSPADVTLFLESTPGQHGLVVGSGHPIEPNHAFYARSGPSGVSTVGSEGWVWDSYSLYIYESGGPPIDTTATPGGN